MSHACTPILVGVAFPKMEHQVLPPPQSDSIQFYNPQYQIFYNTMSISCLMLYINY